MAVIMLLGIAPLAGISAVAADASTGGVITQLPPTVTFTVPETIWLTQAISGTSPAAVSTVAAYSNIDNTNGTQATGTVAFSAAGATDVSITAKRLDNSAAITTFAGSGSDSFSYDLLNGASVGTAVASNSTVIVEWVASYKLPSVATGTFTSKAYSVIYAPNSQTTGAGLTSDLTFNGGGDGNTQRMQNRMMMMNLVMGLQTVDFGTLGTNYWTVNPTTVSAQIALAAGSPSTQLAPANKLRDIAAVATANDAQGTDRLLKEAGGYNRLNSGLTFMAFASGQDTPTTAMHEAVGANATANTWNYTTGRASNITNQALAYRAVRLNFQGNSRSAFEGQGMATSLASAGTVNPGTQDLIQSVGSMNVDSSRFGNLGQVPGLHFSSIRGYDEIIAGNLNSSSNGTNYEIGVNNFNGIENWVKFGDAAQQNITFNTYSIGTELWAGTIGQHFSSNGSEVTVPTGSGTKVVNFDVKYGAKSQHLITYSSQKLYFYMVNQSEINTQFTLNYYDKTTLRSDYVLATESARYPDEFYANNNSNGNSRLKTLTTYLGDPTSAKTDANVSEAAAADAAVIGRQGSGAKWELQTYALNVTDGSYTVKTLDAKYSAGYVAGYFLPGEVVTLTAGTKANHHFASWSSNNGGSFGNIADETTTFTIGTGATTVTANFDEDPKYALTVSNGTGGGSYFEGAVVSVSANAAPANYHFDKWTGDIGIITTGSITSPSISVTIPSTASSLTATYAEDQKYTVSVTGGTGSGSYYAGATVSVTLSDTTNFLNWTATGITLADNTATSFSFTMPAGSVTLVPNYVTTLYSDLTVVNGTGSGTYAEGAAVAIEADAPPAHYHFKAWTGNTAGIADVNAASTTITIQSDDAVITATYEEDAHYTLTVVNGTGGGSFYAGTSVAIAANAPSADKNFSGWTSNNGGSFGNAGQSSTSFVMPEGNVTVTANYALKPTYALTVNGGTGGGSYYQGYVATVTAGAAPANKHFAGWTGDVAYLADASAATTTFTMPGRAASVTATYENDPQYSLVVTNGTGGGSYYAGDVVTITANTIAKKNFIGWTGDIAALADANLATTTVTMPAATVRVAASYEDIVDFDALNALIAQCEAMTQDNASDADWNAFQTALADAKAVAANASATQAQVNSAVTALNTAVSKLSGGGSSDDSGLGYFWALGIQTHYLKTFWNWILYIVFFGWIWFAYT
jgi:hypothetical protein